MGGAPVIVELRPGVMFAPDAAKAIQRLELDWGSEIPFNSTYRDWDLQYRMWVNWTRFVNGLGPKPNHSLAVHPDYSRHTTGNAFDSNLWVLADFNKLAEEHGFIRVAKNDPTERHHYEYQWWMDQHYGEDVPTETEDEEMATIIEVWECPAWKATKQRVEVTASGTRTVPDGHAQQLLNDKVATFKSFATNAGMLYAVSVIQDLAAQSELDTRAKLAEFIAKSGATVSTAELEAALKLKG